MTFSRRIIEVEFQLGTGDFGKGGADTLSLSGMRCSASITRQGVSSAELDLRIWGMTLDQMNRLTVLNNLAVEQVQQNTVTVKAGDEDAGTAVCFQGTVWEAWIDGSQPAEMSFYVHAFAGLHERRSPIPPTSYKGTVDAALALSGIASQIGWGFENGGVTAQFKNPYWPGDAEAQIKRICEAAPCHYAWDDVNQVLAVWPIGKERGADSVRLAPDSGLVGYPALAQNTIRLKSIYNPSLVYGLSYGKTINVESAIAAANGSWAVAAVAHSLESNMPDGAWFTDVECGLLGHL